MNKYELITILKSADIAALDQYKQVLRDVLKKYNVEIAREEEWGTRNVHHELDGATTGFFLVSNCMIDPTKIADLRRELHITDGVMRHMIKRVA